jgi:hypothetical protein
MQDGLSFFLDRGNHVAVFYADVVGSPHTTHFIHPWIS